ncbi:hypothetical protein MAPG_07614 [Magnaporthiopsis poae ATCC 64411]|uniref:Uncharacterized protein n=1 Tax=Magnaporthiopsis poae (strain ATCC 64411 / 73-15) TaxID=644358 RepID=A0A0C4E552_MAGP6|nr:hypothetical protein MAPG_07614 [Magnaporthiopsis poae ATCC 64411]
MSRTQPLSQAGARLLRGRLSVTSFTRPASAAQRTSQYHWTSAARLPYKDDQDRESLKPKAQEYVKGDKGGDDAAAHKDDAAFNPDKTNPETEKDTAGNGSNPLEFSPANKDLSAVKEQEGKTSGQQKQKRSGGSHQQK